MDLFKSQMHDLPGTPMAERIRPKKTGDVLGQQNAYRLLQRLQKTKSLPSLIFWGPPGCGKTSLALTLVDEFNLEKVIVNAVETGAKSLKEICESARERRMLFQKQTVLFLDEIHRLNKAQQDILLPFLERGEIILIGATTENPSYELNRALLSRCELIVFNKLSETSLELLLRKAAPNENYLDEQAKKYLIEYADGDGRRLINSIEILLGQYPSTTSSESLSVDKIKDFLSEKIVGYDKDRDQHYDVISAFIKSIRGSDANAGLYYLARMLKGGESPSFISRRLVILASEDIGNADPKALPLAIAAAQAVKMIGLPEAAINLAQAVTYLASAPKSNRSYLGLKKAQDFVEKTGTLDIPLSLRSSRTEAMKSLSYGSGYKYPHDFEKSYIEQNYLPTEAQDQIFYEPSERGYEKNIKIFLNWLKSSS